MASNGVLRTVLSAQTMKGASESATTSALSNANEEAKKSDPKGTKKQPSVNQKKAK